MNFIKLIKLLIITIVIVSIAYLVYVVETLPDFQGGKIMIKPPNEYLSIFNSAARKELIADYILKPKYDSTICRYLYDNYIIQEYVINITSDKSLSDLIEVSHENELNAKNTFNNEVRCRLFTMSYKTIFPSVNHLRVSLYGSEIKINKRNDTMLSIYSKIENASIKCNYSDTSAIFCQTNESLLPVEFLFLKREKKLFFLMMSINHEKQNLYTGNLYTLISR